jgi:hypothetical protein
MRGSRDVTKGFVYSVMNSYFFILPFRMILIYRGQIFFGQRSDTFDELLTTDDEQMRNRT